MPLLKRIKQYLYKLKNNFWTFDVVDKYANQNRNIFFIQIGSNDGSHGDPISNYVQQKGWEGILVEPVPYLFNRLKDNYKKVAHNLHFENSAISPKAGKLPFYRLKKSDYSDLPEWYDQLGTFDKKLLMSHEKTMPHFDELFIEDEVNAITFTGLLEKYKTKNANLIHIDTEGFDYEILQMIPFDILEPDVIMFEHKCLSNDDYSGAVQLLKDNYFVVKKTTHHDTIAVKKNIVRKL